MWEDDDFVFAASGVPIRSFNNVFLKRPLQSRARLDDVTDHFRQRGIRYRLRILEPVDDGTETALAASGFERQGGIPGLVLPDLRAESAGVSGLSIRRVGDDSELHDHAEIVAAAFHWPIELLGRVFTRRLIEATGWLGYVGYAEGVPVAALQLLAASGVAGVYYVATLEEYRKRGLGAAMTRHALNEGAALGCGIASLQASPLGQRIYERMGFRIVAYYQTYVPGSH